MASSTNLATELTAICAQIRPDMNKYIAEVTRACKAEAYKGHSHAKVYLFDCLSIAEEVEQEVELLGITVDTCTKISWTNTVVLEVHWPKGGSTTGVCQPTGLELGNLKRVCKICLEEETMCRLHPCGHIIGMDCAKALMERPCPFCRQKVRFVHPIFEP